jgi:hypothetical protein
VQAQFTYVLDQTIPVKDEQGNDIPLAWSGGLNAAHYNTLDLNGDGEEDLVIYDRMGDKVLTFLNQENTYRYAPEFEATFPDAITNWLLLRDYNCDGRKDIFTGNILGIKVYTNVTAPGQNLTWEEFSFYTGFPGSKSEVLLTKGFSGKINLQLQFDDLPSITDADGDGDLDIFSMRFVGAGTIEYHQNFSMERYGTCDSLDFERVTQQWGNFTECDCAEFAFNNEDCAPTGGRIKHAGGKSLLMLDVDGNSSLDVLFSEAECTNLYALKNQGTTASPILNSFINFPEATPVDFQIFPAAFYEDVDFDGRKDLISIPNIFSKTPAIQNADLNHSNWLYKNTGTNASPVFTYVTNSFLQNQMIDVGDNAVPAFIDYDGDGDQDLFVSQHNGTNSIATIRLYENTGTVADPGFTLADQDAFGFSALSYNNLKIQFADLNHDLRTDLVFTSTDILNGQTRLYYWPNRSNTGFDFTGQTIQSTDIAILSSENITVVDVDGDGFQDLLVGKSNGALQYWRNQRVSETPSFMLEDDTFLNISANVVRQNISGTAADLDADGKIDLILGDQRGVVHIISNFREATDVSGETTNIIFNSLTKDYQSKNLGGRIWPVTANLYNTNEPSIIVGNTLGGIYILRNDEGESLPEDPVISIYPNPVMKRDVVHLQIDRAATAQVFGSLGQTITSPVNIPANEKYDFQMPYLAGGVYILRFTVRNKSFIRRLVLVD